MKIGRILLFLAALFAASPAFAQSSLLQSGPITAGHIPTYNSTGTQAVVKDGGGAGGGRLGTNPSEFGLTVRSPTGTYPAANAGTGPLFANFCDYDAPTNNAGGYHYLCMSPNAQGGGLIAYGAGGGAAVLPFQFYINGVPYIPGGVSNSIVVGSTAVTGGTNGGLLYDNNGALGNIVSVTGVTSALAQPLNAAGGLVGYSYLGTGVGSALGQPLNSAGGLFGYSGLGTGVGAALALPATGSGGIVLQNNPTIPGLPASAGGGGLYVCVDSTGVLYKKASCP
jgi:hypothetical protein